MSRLVLGGFPAFGEDNACIVSASLASADHLDGGTIYAQSGSTAVYGGGGVRFDGGEAGVGWTLTDAQSTELRNGGRITFYVSPDAVDSARTVTAVESIVTTFTGASMGDGTQTPLFRHEPTTSRLSSGGTANSDADTRTHCIGSGKPDLMRVDITWNYGRLRIYYDYLLGTEFSLRPIATFPATAFKHILLGGAAGVNAAYNSCEPTSVYSNFELSTRPLWLPVSRGLEQLLVLGDSFADAQGDYPDDSSDSQWAITGTQAAIAVQDGGFVPALHRALAKRGLYIGTNKILKYAVGGSGVEGGTTQLEAQIDSLIADHRQGFASVIQIGTNDVNSHVLETITIDASWQSTYEAQIDRLLARGCERIVISNVCSRRAATASQTTAYDDATALANEYIANVAASYSEVVMADQFARMGGHDVTLEDFKSDDIHPLPPGATKLADEAAKMLATLL